MITLNYQLSRLTNEHLLAHRRLIFIPHTYNTNVKRLVYGMISASTMNIIVSSSFVFSTVIYLALLAT